MAEYLDKVYNALKTKVDGYNDDINVFKEKMQDPNYINKVHKVLQLKISGYNDDINVFQKKLSGEINITPKKETKTAAFQEPEMQPSDMEEQVQSPEVTPVKQEAEQETEKETPFFQGIFGKALDAVGKIGKVAKIVNPQIGGGLEKGVEIFDDVARAINAGVVQGKQIAPSGKVMLLGPNASSEDINTLIEASKEAAALKPSDEMIKFATEYQGGGETTFSFLKALAKNPEVAPELLVTSFSMLANPASAGAFGTTVGSSALLGAAFTPEVAGAGAIPAAIGSLPYAMAAANTTLETGATFVELLQEELNGKDFTEENVRAILEDEDKLAKLRAKSFAKGAIVGVFDAITGRVAGSVGAKLGTGANAKRVLAAASASGIEMAGGSLGEAASRAAIGQEMDIAEIGLEGIAEAPMAIPSVLSAALKMPSYKINGQKVSEPEFESFMKNLSDEDLTKLNITIDNDKRGYTKQIQDRILNYQTKKSILEADPTLTEGQANEIVPLQRKLQELEGNNTEIAKKKKAELKQKIDEIQTMEVPMVTEVVEQAPIEEVVAEKPIVAPKEGQPVIESAVIEVGGKIYEGKNHAEAILNAQKDGQDISKVDRQAEGKFRLDNGEIIDRAQAKEMYGQDRSELLIEQDNASMEANKEYEKLKQQYEKEPTKENVKPMPEGVSGVRTEGEERKTSTELRTEEEVKPTPQKIKILGKDVNMYNDYIPSKVEDVETDAMYTFNANSKDGIPTLLQDIAYANKKEVNGVKTENWYASISGDDLIKLYPKKEVTEQAITTAEAKPKQEQALIEEGKKEVTDLKSGKTTIKNPIKIFKGLFGKRNIDGTIRTAHPDVIGTFGSVDEKIAEKYAGEQKEMTTFDIPAGTTLEVIKVQNPKKGMSILRQEETDLVNNSDAQVVKLITVDTSGTYEDQYIIRDKNLLKPSNIAITTKTSTNENERNQRDQRNQEAKNVLEEKGQEPQAETAPISLEEKVSLVSDPAALNKVTEGTHMVTAKGKAPVEVKNTIKWEQAQIVKRLKKLQKLIDCE